MPPGQFISALEEYRQIHKLDQYIVKRVCLDYRESVEKGLPFVPVSVNFSRLDFELMDAVGFLEDLLEKYNIPKEYLHVEITESAVLNAVDTMTYTFYQKNVKPKPQAEVKGWVCDVCGYIYEGDPLPEDFICPLCKHPASDFSKLG